MPFQIVIYLPVLGNNCNNIFLRIKLRYSDTPGVVLAEEQPFIS